MQHMRVLSVFALLAVLLAGCSTGDGNTSQVSVGGLVLTGEGEPASNCLVDSSNRFEEDAVMTDDSGRFEMSVRPGEQTISALCPVHDLRGEIVIHIPQSGKNDVSLTVK